jgi:hypothetical protein
MLPAQRFARCPELKETMMKAGLRLEPLEGEKLAATVAEVVNLPLETGRITCNDVSFSSALDRS